VIVKGDDPAIKNGKPSPEIFLVATSRFPTPPVSNSNILVFEDAPNGVEAAKAAGMFAVMIPDPQLDKEKQKLADQVLGTMEEFNPTEWGLPSYDQE